LASKSEGDGNTFTSADLVTNDSNGDKHVINLKMPANVTISAKVSRAEKDALKSLSKALGVSQSTLIRIAIKKLIIEYYRNCRGEIGEHISILAEVLEKTIESEGLLCRD
jgi:hypothetical protein